MGGTTIDRTRRRVGCGIFGLLGLSTAWALTPGLPVVWGPSASAQERAVGLALFEHTWRPYDAMAGGDGLGPVFNGRSCVECHFQGGVGGGGGNKHNVRAFEAHPTRDRPDLQGGLIHAFAVENRYLEDQKMLRVLFPIIPGGIRQEGGCQILTRDFDPVRTESVNSTALFGAGWIDRISGKTIRHQGLKRSVAKIGRELSLDFDGVVPGRPRVLPDGRVGKFGWKAQFATLEEFVAAACANEIGLGNPRMEQARPLGRLDYPDTEADLDAGQFGSLVAFVETLPRPEAVAPEDPGLADRAARGEALFGSIGCAACHIPDMGGVAGIYSDFLLHRLDDRSKGGSGYRTVETPEVPLPEAHPLADEWKTPPLWGVADSAPYFHDGGAPTLQAAILRHEGNAAGVTRAFRALSPDEQGAILAFLGTLKAPAEARPAEKRPRSELASAR